jgi:protein FrlC
VLVWAAVKLAYASNGFTRVTLPETVHALARLGYAGIELLADTPHWSPSHAENGAEAEVVEALARTGLSVSNVNANTAVGLSATPPPDGTFEPSLGHSDPAVRARRVEYTRAAMRFARRVGASCVSVASGRVERDVPPEVGREHLADSLRGLCAYADELGLRLGVEAEPALLVERTDELLWLFDRVGHPALGANLDLGHALCAGEDPCVAIERLRGRIWNVHIEDIRDRKHFHRVPGEGDVDFVELFTALRRTAYVGFVTVELYTCADRAEAAATRSLEVLRAALAAAHSSEGSHAH